MKINLRHRKKPTWRGSPALVMALALVSLSVFTWGLQYKLSLYRTVHHPRSTIPAAKLLSPKERPALVNHQSRQPGLSSPALIPAAEVISFPTIDGILAATDRRRRGYLRQHWWTAEVYSKPPPIGL
jgi:hypothetical protein